MAHLPTLEMRKMKFLFLALLVSGCAMERGPRAGQCVSIEAIDWTWMPEGLADPPIEPGERPLLNNSYLLTDSLGSNQIFTPGYVLRPLGPLGTESPRWSESGDSLVFSWGGGFHGFRGVLAPVDSDPLAWIGTLDPYTDEPMGGEWQPTVQARLVPCTSLE